MQRSAHGQMVKDAVGMMKLGPFKLSDYAPIKKKLENELENLMKVV